MLFHRYPQLLAYIMLFIAPAFFTTNVVFGRSILTVEPFTLAFLRWSFASMILLAFCRRDWPRMISVTRENGRLVFFCAFLAFWICGGVVYFALHYTTATNGILIYTTPPILILAIEAAFRGRDISVREISGIVIALLGAFMIILQGDLQTLTQLEFNTGDLLFVVAAISWAIYSVLLKSEKFATLETLPLLAMLGVCGSIILAPFAIYETLSNASFPNTRDEWLVIAGIVTLSSIASFWTFQYGVKILGASIAGIFMYLLPPWGLLFAWSFLGETLENYHLLATILILSGIIVATFPMRLLRRKTNQ